MLKTSGFPAVEEDRPANLILRHSLKAVLHPSPTLLGISVTSAYLLCEWLLEQNVRVALQK